MSDSSVERLLFFDFDGTLSAIRLRPALARLPVQNRRLLQALSRQPGTRVGIVSGRALTDLRRRVGLPRLGYVGNHGLEILWDGHHWLHPEVRRHEKRLRQLVRRLHAELADIPGVEIEDKKRTVSVHVRRVRVSNVPVVESRVRGAVFLCDPELKVRPGKKVLEIYPPIDWHKGEAVRLLRRRYKHARVVYIGDDRTDEDVFRTLPEPHLTVRVGLDGPTHARARVPFPAVRKILQRLVRYPLNPEKWLIE